MSYRIHGMSSRACNVFYPTLKKDLPSFPPKKALDREFPFQHMKIGDAFKLLKNECIPPVYSKCREYIARYNRTYHCHFVILKYEWGWEIARIA